MRKVSMRRNDKRRIFYLFIVTLLLFWQHSGARPIRYCYDVGFKYFKNFSIEEYSQLSQSRSIPKQERCGIIYVGNQAGTILLEGLFIIDSGDISWWEFLLYAILISLLTYLIIRWRRSIKLERERQRLEQIVKDRTKELEEKNQQFEKKTLELKEHSEKLKEMNHMKALFLEDISYDFRTDLTLIVGPLEQILSNCRDKKLEKKLKLILRNSQRLLTLTNQLLDISRFASGKMRLQACRQNIIHFLKGILASFELLTIQKKLELQFVAEEENIPVYFDSEKLEEVVCTLLINAIKFTPPGGKIIVTVSRIHATTKEEIFPPIPGFLEISVCDTGIGVPKERLAHIFNSFSHSEDSTYISREHNYKGIDIGLALTKELVELHHGSVDALSREGENRGTEFIIRLPMGNTHLEPDEIVELPETPSGGRTPPKIPPLYTPEEEENEFEAADENGQSEKEIDKEPENREKNIVLVVDDNPIFRKYIRSRLEPLYKVEEAVDGQDGINKAKEIIPDLIISDILMPEKDGYALCNTLKKEVKTSHIPIILLTAKASQESIVQGLETGAVDYITKPFNTKILTIRIKNLIDLRRQMQLKIKREKMLSSDEIVVSPIDKQFITELQDVVEKNLSNPDFNEDQLCQKLHMRRSDLFRKIQALTGESPKQYILSYRLNRAAQLLKDNLGNVTEVAFKVGFTSTADFARCFKEKFHQLPTSFQISESQSKSLP